MEKIEQIKQSMVIISPLIGMLIAAIGVVWGIFKQDDNCYEVYAGKYYTLILEPLINKGVKGELDIEKECTDLMNNKYHYIPTYICYMVHLMNKGSQKYTWEDIKKIMTIDYLMNRPSATNAFWKGVDKLNRKNVFIGNLLVIAALFALFVGTALAILLGIITGIQVILQQAKMKEFWQMIGMVVILITLIILIKKTMLNISDDLYSKSIKEMEKAIKARLNAYKRLERQYKKYNPEIQSSELLFLDIAKCIIEEK